MGHREGLQPLTAARHSLGVFITAKYGKREGEAQDHLGELAPVTTAAHLLWERGTLGRRAQSPAIKIHLMNRDPSRETNSHWPKVELRSRLCGEGVSAEA